MKLFSRITALACAVSLLTVSAGCQKAMVTEQTTQTEITFSWWGNDARNKYTIEAIERFEELHPEIKVRCNYSEWSGYETRNKVWMISDTESDVMQINYGWLQQYSPDGLGYYDIYNLSAMDTTQFTPDVLKYGIVEDHLNAVPIAMNAATVYINKSIYDKYGLEVPATWDDFFHAAEVMKGDGIYPVSASSKSMWLFLIAYTEQTTGKRIVDDKGKLTFSAEDFKVMIEFYQKLVNEQVMPLVDLYERMNLENEVYAGCVAWVSDAVNYFGSAIDKGRSIVAADYTTIDGSNPGAGWYAKPATMYAVSKNTEHPQEAGLLLDFLMNSSDMAILQGIEKGIPLSSAARIALLDKNALNGIQYDASQRMTGRDLNELNPVLETTGLIEDFFSTCNDVIYHVSPLDTAVQDFYQKIKTDYFQ